MIKINFDTANNPEVPTIILARKNGDKLGLLNANSIEISDSLNDASEISFNVHKYVDGVKCNLWEQIVDFKLVHCVEWDTWFEIKVELDEETETVKTVYCTRLGHAELSQIMLYNIEINTEDDIARVDYKTPTVLFNVASPESSLLNRIMEKAPHYSVIHVDNTIANIQKTFTFNDTSIYDAFQEISKEIHCLFILHSNSDDQGNILRTISVYDLESNCRSCGHRGEFTTVCPECGSKDINEGYGEDTNIFISSDEFSESIQLTANTDEIKNCFKLEAGDELMTATIRNCNPNGTDYIWYRPSWQYEDMSQELINKLNSYDKKYDNYQNDYIANIDSGILSAYNKLVVKYQKYNEDLQLVPNVIKGYPALMEAYYNTIDLSGYLESALMPDINMDTSVEEQVALLTRNNLSPVAVAKIDNLSLSTANNAVLSMAKVIIDSRYRVKINTSKLENNTWIGNFTVTDYSNEDEFATSSTVYIEINDDYENFVKQKLEKAIKDEDVDNLSITGLFKLEYGLFCDELKKYCLDSLDIFYNACQSCIDILIEQGVSDSSTWDNSDSGNLYNNLYVPYLNKLEAIEAELKVRNSEIDSIIGVYNEDDVLIQNGLQANIVSERNMIQKELDFESCLGDNWLEFCSYRRESKYSNENYISDGYTNAELFKNALEFIKIAKNDIYKSAELQHSISTTLKNLLFVDKFKPLMKDFKVGNWLRIMVDDKLYKFRLIKYSIDYDSLDNISVEFSDVTEVSSTIKSVKDVIEQATVMASSYSSVQRQASKGSKSNETINNWFNTGIDATHTKIIGGANNQTQTWDKHGMLFRKYDDITNSYDDVQLKIINSTIAITDDNWKTTKTAIGNFYYTDPVTKQLKSAYGINGEVIVGKLLIGEGLGIYNKSGSLTFDENGFIVSNGVNKVSINPNSEYSVFNIENSNGSVLSFDEDGNLVIVGDITARSLTLLDDVSVQANKVNGLSKVAISGKYSDLDNSPDLTVYIAKDGTIGTTPAEGVTGFKVSKAGLLTASNAVIYGTIYATDGEFSGKITSNVGEIAGFTIMRLGLYAQNAALFCGTKGFFTVSNEEDYERKRTISTEGSILNFDCKISDNESERFIKLGVDEYDNNKSVLYLKTIGDSVASTKLCSDGWCTFTSSNGHGSIDGGIGYFDYTDGSTFVFYGGECAFTSPAYGSCDIKGGICTLTSNDGSESHIQGGFGSFTSDDGTNCFIRGNTCTFSFSDGSLGVRISGSDIEAIGNITARRNIIADKDIIAYGNITADGTISQGSDERKKNVIEWDDKYDDIIMELTPIQFTWNNKNDSFVHTGIGAQSTLNLYNKYGFNNNGLVHYDNERDFYTVAYSELHALEIAAIQKNRKLIEELRQQIEKKG